MSFLSVAEAKLLLGTDSADVSNDEQLKLMIAINSAIIMRACNRMFARQTVEESWREMIAPRIFLTHWPVRREDIESVSVGGRDLARSGYELEEASGKLTAFGGAGQSIVVTYAGGFDLPKEAPLPLKQASLLLLRQAKSEASREAVEGIRSISHKESRVMFFDPATVAKSAGQTAGTLGTGVLAADQLLFHYMRFWV